MRYVLLVFLALCACTSLAITVDVKDLENYMIHCFEVKKAEVKGKPTYNCDTEDAKTLAPIAEKIAGSFKEVDGKESAANEVKGETLIKGKVDPKADKKGAPAVANAAAPPKKQQGNLAPSAAPVAAFVDEAEDLEVNNPYTGPKWPGGVVAYCWDWTADLHIPTKIAVWRGMGLIEANTAVTFRKVRCDAPGHKLRIRGNLQGRASSSVGYQGAALAGDPATAANAPSTEQTMTFDGFSFNRFSGAHELIHTLGFAHTQSRADRDQCVTVGAAHNGNANYDPWGGADHPADEYNYESIMHYPFGANFAAKAVADRGAHCKGNADNAGQRDAWNAYDTTSIGEIY